MFGIIERGWDRLVKLKNSQRSDSRLLANNKLEQPEIVNKINNQLNNEPLHMNSLDYYNPWVQKVIEKFNDKDPILVYNRCRIYFWFKCRSLEDFEKDIKDKLNTLNDINNLFCKT
jgi:hypothetical protein